jgi:heterodisulfide reductase subunit D
MANYFENALSGRIDEMLDACTRCGKCVEACPVKTPAGVAAEPQAVINGVIDILHGGDGAADSRRWASTCMLTGDCIKACEEGVNPRFLLAMARLAMAKDKAEPRERRREGVEGFRKLNLDVTVQSRMQADDDVLARLGQKVAAGSSGDAAPDFVFYTGCNLLKTPHIALLALDIMDALGTTYKVMGGPTHCCGVIQLRTGDTDVSANMAANTMGKLAQSGQVLSWCPSCHVQFTEVMMPAYEHSAGSKPFEMTPFMRFLGARIDDLKPLLRHTVRMRVALHRHPGIPGVVEAALCLLASVPGVQVVDLGLPAIGLMSNALRTLPDYKRELQLRELEAARDVGVDALVAVYHADHRELCAHERDWPFVVINLLEVIGASMGIAHRDKYKQLKILQDVDLIVAECQDLLTRHGIRDDLARQSIKAMLEDQPLPLREP